MSRQRDNLVASVWRDRKLVYLMSTNSHPEGNTTVQRRERDGSVQQIPCPPSVVEYNKFMGGVDKADQLRKYYRVHCKTRKFYRYVFWFLLDSCVVNAFILMKNFRSATDVTLRQATFKNFRIPLALGLIGNYNSRQRYALPAAIKDASVTSVQPAAKRRRVEGGTPSGEASQGHFPIKGYRSRCFYCWNFKDHRRADTCVRCRKCGKAFCLVARDPPEDGPSCFERYHTECL